MSRFDLFFVLVDECNEVTDYAIARRIVDLHTRQQESVEREYTMVRVVFRVFSSFSVLNSSFILLLDSVQIESILPFQWISESETHFI